MPNRVNPNALSARILQLSVRQVAAVESIVSQFERSYNFIRDRSSDLISECVLQDFGDSLRVHHCFSTAPFTKDKFEFAIVRSFGACGVSSSMASRGNPGHDVTIAGIPISLKTQANTGIRPNTIHISKFMELGKGQWGDRAEDLVGLRQQFFDHMRAYERVLTLRYLPTNSDHHYELVEIPKKLLQQAARGEFKMSATSSQYPKPGTCTVLDGSGRVELELYFDGGTERKLQIRKIRKELCAVHAEWSFAKDATLVGAKVL